MPKVRKQKRKQKFRYDINRKRQRNKQNRVHKIQIEQVEEAWDKGRSVKTNLTDMGLAYDPNKTLHIPSIKEILICTDKDVEMDETSVSVPEKQQVAEELEKLAKKPKGHSFRLPNNQLQWVTYLLDKYGEDHKAMARDPRNYDQETWKQIRTRMRQFKLIPEQYNEYLRSRKKEKLANSTNVHTLSTDKNISE